MTRLQGRPPVPTPTPSAPKHCQVSALTLTETHDARHDAYPRTSRRISYWNLAYALTEPNRQ